MIHFKRCYTKSHGVATKIFPDIISSHYFSRRAAFSGDPTARLHHRGQNQPSTRRHVPAEEDPLPLPTRSVWEPQNLDAVIRAALCDLRTHPGPNGRVLADGLLRAKLPLATVFSLRRAER